MRLKQLGLTDQEIEKRYEIVSKYIALHCPVPFSYPEIVGAEKWAEYKQRRANLLALLVENQKFCDELNKTIADHIKKGGK